MPSPSFSCVAGVRSDEKPPFLMASFASISSERLRAESSRERLRKVKRKVFLISRVRITAEEMRT